MQIFNTPQDFECGALLRAAPKESLTFYSYKLWRKNDCDQSQKRGYAKTFNEAYKSGT